MGRAVRERDFPAPSSSGWMPSARAGACHDRDVIRSLVMDAAMTPAERATLPNEDELLALLSDKARSGM